MKPEVVTAELVLHLLIEGEGACPIGARLRYDVEDPYAVTLTFLSSPSGSSSSEDQDSSDGICWTFARQLLTDGITHPVGNGDVRVHPQVVEGGQEVVVSMSSPSGTATFHARMRDVVEFLTDTYAMVPTGSETRHLDVDAAIAAILGY